MGVLRWFDRNLWGASALVLVLLLIYFIVANSFSRGILWTLGSDQKGVYSAVASAAGSLLGFLIAAITILASFPPRSTGTGSSQAQRAVQKARARVMAALGWTAVMLLALTVFSIFGLMHFDNVDVAHVVNYAVVALSVASVVGLILSGLGLALAIAERSKHSV